MEQSRVEAILSAIIDEDISNLPESGSRTEILLKAIGALVGQKLDDNQGSDNAGKLLGIGSDGSIEPAAAWGTGIIVTEALVSGEDYSLNIVEDD